jgi:hypothetical protein
MAYYRRKETNDTNRSRNKGQKEKETTKEKRIGRK